MADKEQELYSNEETKRRFEAALRGARIATSHPMKDFVGKGERQQLEERVESKRTFKQSQNSSELGDISLEPITRN